MRYLILLLLATSCSGRLTGDRALKGQEICKDRGGVNHYIVQALLYHDDVVCNHKTPNSSYDTIFGL